MRLDHDLMRKILLATEEDYCSSETVVFFKVSPPGVTQIVDHSFYWLVESHIGLMKDGELLFQEEHGSIRPTLKGHEAIGLIRDESVWNEARNIIKEKVGGAPWGVTLDLVRKILEKSLMSPVTKEDSQNTGVQFSLPDSLGILMAWNDYKAEYPGVVEVARSGEACWCKLVQCLELACNAATANGPVSSEGGE